MSFSYYDNDNKLKRINLKSGTEWKQYKTNNNNLNSIFNKIDNGDGVIQEHEIIILERLMKIADNSGIVNTKNNQKVESFEMQTVLKQLESNKINLAELYMETFAKLNEDKYSLENLKKKYPENKYTIDIHGEDITICLKSTGREVLTVYKDHRGTYITEGHGKSEFFRCYDKDGNLQSINYNGKEHYKLAYDLHKDICAKNAFGLPTTGNDIEKHIMKLTKDNAENVLLYYKETYGETLEEALDSEWGLDNKIKQRAFNHIESLFGYNRNYKNTNSRVQSKFHNGDTYSVETKGHIISVTNKKNNKKVTINLDILTKNLSYLQKYKAMAYIQQLPGEVLVDLAVEVDSFSINTMSKGVGAYFRHDKDNITLNENDLNSAKHSFVHELGHAMDFLTNGVPRTTYSKYNFKATFEKELENFKKAGYKQHPGAANGADKPFGYLYCRKNGSNCDRTSTYATVNEEEMFAECYQYLTTGSCGSADMLEDFFPETLTLADKIIQEIRSMPEYKRHKHIT